MVPVVLDRQHTLNSQTLTVAPFYISNNELLLENINSQISDEVIDNFFGAKLAGNDVVGVVFNEDRTKALVKFKETFGKDIK